MSKLTRKDYDELDRAVSEVESAESSGRVGSHAPMRAKFEFAHKADDFAEEYFVGPFVVSDDVVNGWLLFFNHKQHGFILLADLNRLASITKLFLKGEIQTAASFLLVNILDRVGVVVSRGHWTIGPLHIHCDDTDGWS